MSYQPTNRTILTSLNSNHLQSNFSSKSLNHSLSFPSKSPHTRQEFKAESDINTIMARYIRTGELPHVNTIAPQYFEASGVDFQTHMQAIAEAKSLFAQLPSAIRNRFYNDPGQFVDFCSEPANRTELAHMGLLSPEATRSVLYPEPPQPTGRRVDYVSSPAPEFVSKSPVPSLPLGQSTPSSEA